MKFGLELHKDALEELPIGAKVSLAAACAQRHSEIYQEFLRSSGVRRHRRFDQVLEAIWRDAECEQLSQERLEKALAHAERLVPGEGAEIGAFDGNAEMAALSLIHCIRVRLYGESSDVMWAAHQAFSSIWDFLTNRIGKTPQIDLTKPDAIAQWEGHRLVQAEHRRQERDLEDVRRMLEEQCSAKEMVDLLEKRSKREAKMLLPIGGA